MDQEAFQKSQHFDSHYNINYNDDQLNHFLDNEKIQYQSKTEKNSCKKDIFKSFSSRLYVWGQISQDQVGIDSLLDNDRSILLDTSQQYHDSSMTFQLRGQERKNIGQNININGNDFLERNGSPRRVQKFSEMAIVSASCGKNHAGFISNNGELYMIGANDGGQLGIGEYEASNYFEQPVLIHYLYYKSFYVDQVACGHSHTLIVTKNGQVFSWGFGNFGALGHGNFESKNQPIEIQFFQNTYNCSSKIKMIQCGAHHSSLLNSKGQLYLWGAGEVGQLGSEQRLNESSPLLVQTRNLFEEREFIDIVACGYFHTIILSSKGRVLQTGQDNNQNYDTNQGFSEIQNIPINYIINIKAKEYSVALNNLGQLIIWQSPKDLYVVNHNQTINDFDVCKSFVLFRCKEKFYKWKIKEKCLQEVIWGSQKINKFSILSCGHNYIIGIKTKKKRQGLSQHNKSTKEPLKNKIQKRGRYDPEFNNTSGTIYGEDQYKDTSDKQSTCVQRISSRNRSKSGESKEVRHLRQNSQSTIKTNNILKSKLSERKTCKKEITNNEYNELSYNKQHTQFSKHSINSNKEEAKSAAKKLISDRRKSNLSITNQNEIKYQRYQKSEKKDQNFIIQNININPSPRDSPSKLIPKLQQIQNNVTEQASFYLAPNSMRISYDDINQHNKSSNICNYNKTTLNKDLSFADNIQYTPQKYQQTSQNINIGEHLIKSKYDQQMTPTYNNNIRDILNIQITKHCDIKSSKDHLKQALSQEIEKRLQLENQLTLLQIEFESFRKEVGVDQMKKVLSESQDEYQKLYEICVQECQKVVKLNEMWKKEKKLKEDRENQMVELGEEQQMLQNQIRHLEEQLSKVREEYENKDQDYTLIKQTVIEQQKIIDRIKEENKIEKQSLMDRNFDLEEILILNRDKLEEIKQKHEEIVKEKVKDSQINNDLNIQIVNLQEQMLLKDQEINKNKEENLNQQQESQKIKQENQDLKSENEQLQSKIQTKKQSLQECDNMIQTLKQNETELKDQIEQLQIQLKTLSTNQNFEENGSPCFIQGYNQQQIQTQKQVKILEKQQEIQKELQLYNEEEEQEALVQLEKIQQNQLNLTQPNQTDNTESTHNKVKINNIITQNQPTIDMSHFQQLLTPISTNSQKNNGQCSTKTLLSQTKGFSSTSNIKKSKENSPDKLQKIIKQSEVSTNKFINEMHKIVRTTPQRSRLSTYNQNIDINSASPISMISDQTLKQSSISQSQTSGKIQQQISGQKKQNIVTELMQKKLEQNKRVQSRSSSPLDIKQQQIRNKSNSQVSTKNIASLQYKNQQFSKYNKKIQSKDDHINNIQQTTTLQNQSRNQKSLNVSSNSIQPYMKKVIPQQQHNLVTKTQISKQPVQVQEPQIIRKNSALKQLKKPIKNENLDITESDQLNQSSQLKPNLGIQNQSQAICIFDEGYTLSSGQSTGQAINSKNISQSSFQIRTQSRNSQNNSISQSQKVSQLLSDSTNQQHHSDSQVLIKSQKSIENIKKQVKFQIDSKEVNSNTTNSNDNFQNQNLYAEQNKIDSQNEIIQIDDDIIGKYNQTSQCPKTDELIEKLYESLQSDLNDMSKDGETSCNMESLKEKLGEIRKNKNLLEDKIKQYEKKLGK